MKTILLFLLAATAYTQTASYALSPAPKLQFIDQNGNPYTGGLLYTCVSGSTCPGTPQATYADNIGTANTNPIVLDSAGRATIFLNTAQNYKFALQNSFGVTIYTQDNVNGNGASGSAANVTVTQQITGAVGISLNQFATDQLIDARSCGVVPNNSGFDNASAINRCIAFAAATASTPSIVLLPPGEFWVGSTILLNHTSVRLIGAGWGNGSEYANPTIGTILKAMPTFFSGNVGSNFYKNYVLAINCSTDCFDVRAEQMSVDGNGVADSLYVGHTNEQSGYSYITAQNFIHTGGGGYWCGAGNGPTNAAAICGAINGGDQGDGPYEHLQFYPQTNATANSVPIMMVGVLSLKDTGNWTISGTGASTQPLAAGYIGGNGVHLHDVHMEGLQTGFQVGGGTSQLCPNTSVCNGMIGLTTNNIDLTASSSTSSHTMELYDCQQCNLEYTSDQASGGFGIYTNFVSTPITSTDQNVSWLSTRASGGNYWVLSSDPSWDFHLANNNVVLDHNLQLYNDDAFQLLFKSKTGSQYYQKFHLDTSGDMHVFNMSNGTGNWSFENPYAFLSMIGNTGAETDLFLQAPLDSGNNYIRTMLSSQIYWSHANQNWTLANGTLDYGAFYFPNGGGACLSTYPSTSGGTLTNTAFLNNTYWCTYANNHTILGANVPGATDNGSTLQVLGSETVNSFLKVGGVIQSGASGNNDNSGQLAISASNNSSTYNFTGTYSHEPICTTSLDGGVINAFSSPIISGSGSAWTLLIHTNTNVTATANYICTVRP